MAIHFKETFQSIKGQFLAFPPLAKGVIVVGLIFLVVLLILSPAQLAKRTTQSPPSSSSNATGGLQSQQTDKTVVKASLDFIQNLRRSDGYYEYIARFESQCKTEGGQKECPFNGLRMFETTNAWSMLAYLGGYTIYGDKNFLDLASRDFTKLDQWCTAYPNHCSWVLVQPLLLYQVNPDPVLLSFLNREGNDVITAQSDNLMLTSIEARELAMLHKLTGEQKYLDAAQNRMIQAKVRLATQTDLYHIGDARLKRQSCWYALAGAQLLSQQSSIVTQGEIVELLAVADLEKNLINIAEPIEIQPCIEAYFILSEATGEKNYFAYAEGLLDQFVERFWDNPAKPLLYGEGGTIMNSRPDLVTHDGDFVLLTDSAYTVYLLSHLYKKP